MQRIDGRLVYSASDLNDYLACEHLSELERRAAAGELHRPEVSASTKLIAEKGEEHELRHLERLRTLHGERLVAFLDRPAQSFEALAAAEARTAEAMAQGAEIICQATFFDGTFVGRADFLRRIPEPSARFAWSYEVVDTKLAHTPKPYFLVQLCNYAEHLTRLQGSPCTKGAIVLGDGRERRFDLTQYAAYYRRLKTSFLARIEHLEHAYPLACAHCELCAWNARCEAQRDRDGHLSIVAWMRRDHVRRLEDAGIDSISALAAAPPGARPRGLSEHAFTNLQAQAALQERQRASRNGNGVHHFYEFREVREGDGFFKLPVPAPGDVFFDMEGDPIYRSDRGLEYLFGSYLPDEDEHVRFWAKSPAEERAAFEAFMDFCAQRLRRYPGMHVYHYAPYETVALKRLSGRYASRADVLDDFLRRGIFVDLYAVVRQSMRISQPSYSIKKLEAFYGIERASMTRSGDDSIVMFESWLSSRDDRILRDIQRYNDDDCRSTFLLREWLAERRAELAAQRGMEIPWRPEPEARAPAEEPERTALEHALLDALPPIDALEELRDAAPEVRARWLLGNVLSYHRREAKPAWWKYFDRLANPNDLHDDGDALTGLQLDEDVEPYKLSQADKNLVYTFSFPQQEHNLGGRKPLDAHTGKSVEIVRLDDKAGRVEIKLGRAIDPACLRALIPGTPIPENVQRAAVERVAQAYVAGTLEATHPATLDLLLSQPRKRDGSYLFIQGPPGCGKSSRAARDVVALLKANKRVALLASTHKALHHLLRKIEEEAARQGVTFHGCHKASAQTEGSEYRSALEAPFVESSIDGAGLLDNACRLGSATSYAWANPALAGTYDYLYIDEAGQISLADALACAPVARNVVLLGDPLQLKQVSQGSHPIGTDLSILQHLLRDDATIPPDRGEFLETSYRMQPEICAFISENVYEGRLRPAPSTRAHRIDSPGLSGAGLRWIPVGHFGNGRRSEEEAEIIVHEIARLLRGGSVTLSDARGPRPLRVDDILVVSPYNAQRRLIASALEAAGIEGVEAGTVDKFQGKEAPVVFYSMATSSGEDVPRDLSFLFEKNRINVAISRAQCMSVLVCSPRLLETHCSTPEQMALVNLLCAYAEAAAPSR